jgi:hypothetical protein
MEVFRKMKSRLAVSLALAGCLLTGGGASFAHHGANLSFDMNKQLTVTGTVTKFNFANPHSQLYFDATDASGTPAHWVAEMSSPGVLMRTGDWVRNTLKPGDKVTVTMHPSKSGALVGYCGMVELPDGRKVSGDPATLGTFEGDPKRQPPPAQ